MRVGLADGEVHQRAGRHSAGALLVPTRAPLYSQYFQTDFCALECSLHAPCHRGTSLLADALSVARAGDRPGSCAAFICFYIFFDNF